MGSLVQLGGMAAVTVGVWLLAGWGWALIVVGVCLLVAGIAIELTAVEPVEEPAEELEQDDAGQAAA